jgi:outer membrane lipoprotein-sorting protein
MMKRQIGLIALGLSAFASRPVAHPTWTGDDLLARSRATYAALTSYADAGTVDEEYGPAASPIHARHTFRTYYRAPRRFLFDFVKEKNADRYVVWSDDEAFHAWWQATGVLQDFAKGHGATAFTSGAYPTKGSLTQIAPLLFAGAGLTGTLTEFAETTEGGMDNVEGNPCHKLVGVAQSVYQTSGHVANIRAATIWIDARTWLVRRIVEDASAQGPAGNVSRVTTTFAPQVNPRLDDRLFLFVPPPRDE